MHRLAAKKPRPTFLSLPESTTRNPSTRLTTTGKTVALTPPRDTLPYVQNLGKPRAWENNPETSSHVDHRRLRPLNQDAHRGAPLRGGRLGAGSYGGGAPSPDPTLSGPDNKPATRTETNQEKT